ncbi:hypothetical protein CERSUDRAFT_94436 [Gelatoporia subvermispora B]|uniref:Uncharacterized protein n=1 Tax=Ceriporiopsis subvermispora (strain B) TaxID=914234 RepID=M2PM40_CERS8|nr:hypothetical protein CERSUDRAFT_94436 [Gelatoporia subvermispora B]
MSSIIVTHFLLNLRQAAYQPQVSDSLGSLERRTTRQSSSLRFAAVIDNMGEELMYGMDDPSPGAAVGATTDHEYETTNGTVVHPGDLLLNPVLVQGGWHVHLPLLRIVTLRSLMTVAILLFKHYGSLLLV